MMSSSDGSDEEENGDIPAASGECDEDSCAGELQEYLEDASKVEPGDKVQYVINLCFVYVEDFTTDILPFNHKLFKNSKKKHKLSNVILKQEIRRRHPSAKLSNKKQPDLIALLQSDAYKLSEKDKDYLDRQLKEYKDHCQACINESNPSTRADTRSPPPDGRTNITTDDRLRLIEAMLCAEAKIKMASSQECMSRESESDN